MLLMVKHNRKKYALSPLLKLSKPNRLIILSEESVRKQILNAKMLAIVSVTSIKRHFILINCLVKLLNQPMPGVNPMLF